MTLRNCLSSILFALAALFMWNSAATAQHQGAASSSDEPPADEIVVVAHKSERRLRDVAANVTVVTRDDLQSGMSTTIADALRYVPGIDAEGAGTRFGTEGFNIRGIGGNRVALVLDGIPLGDQFSIGNFSNATRDFIDAGLTRRIEVLHGPASALYGSSAIGGVISVTTPAPEDIAGASGRGVDTTATWESALDAIGGTGILAFDGGRHAFLFGGSVRDAGTPDVAGLSGSPDERDEQRTTGLAKFRAAGPAGSELSARAFRYAGNVKSDLHSVLGQGRFRSTTALRGDDDYRLDLLSLQAKLGDDLSPGNSAMLRAYIGTSRVEQRTVDERGAALRPVLIERIFDYRQRLRGVEVQLHRALSAFGADHRLALGAAYRQLRTEELRDGSETGLSDGATSNTVLGEVFPVRDFPLSTTREYGLFLEDTVVLGNWQLIGGMRLDRYRLDPDRDPVFSEDNPAVTPVSLDATELSPKVGLLYRLGEATELYLQYAHGFRAPPFEDANIGLDIPLFNVRAIPNPDLRPESSEGWEAGLRWTGVEASFRVGLFRARYEDFIETKVRLGVDPLSGRLLFQSQNINEARIDGVEAAWSVGLPGLLRSMRFDGSAYVARGRNESDGDALNSVGPGQAKVGLGWQPREAWPELRLNATFTRRWSARSEAAGPLFKPAGHAVFDLLMAKALRDDTTLRIGVLNVADRRYWRWSDVGGLAPDDPLIPYLARPGRSFSVSLNMAWR